MADLFSVLGIPSDESARGIERAYRDLERRFHPERARGGTTRHHREACFAHAVLSESERRRAYERAPREAVDEPEPLAGSAASLRCDFDAPELDETLALVRRDFVAPELPKSGRIQVIALTLRVPPAADEVAIGVPVYHPCPSCHGTGIVLVRACPRCDGEGVLEDEEWVSMPVASTARSVSLDEVGIRSLALEVSFERA